MRLLVYDNPNNPCYYQAETRQELDTAFAMLFKLLDESGYYSRIEVIGPMRDLFAKARAGDSFYIKAILRLRNGLPKETWRLAYTTDTANYEVIRE